MILSPAHQPPLVFHNANINYSASFSYAQREKGTSRLWKSKYSWNKAWLISLKTTREILRLCFRKRVARIYLLEQRLAKQATGLLEAEIYRWMAHSWVEFLIHNS